MFEDNDSKEISLSPMVIVDIISIILNVVLAISIIWMFSTGDVIGYESRASLEARATECTLEHVDPDATTTAAEITESTEEETTTATTKATKKDNKKTTKKTTTTTAKSNNDSYYGGGGGGAIATQAPTQATTKATSSDDNDNLGEDPF